MATESRRSRSSGTSSVGLAPDARLEIVDVRRIEDAERLAFLGSPTVLVDGKDIEPLQPAGVGLG